MIRCNLIFICIAFALSVNSLAQDTISKRHNFPLMYFGNENYGIKPVLGVSAGVVWSKPVRSIDNIPEVISYIPAHPDDKYAEGLYDAGSSLGGNAMTDVISVSGGLEFKINKINIRSLISGTLNGSNFHNTINSDYTGNSIARVNYSGSPDHSSGGAYVYMTTVYSHIIYGINAEIDYPIFHFNKDAFARVVIGGGIREFNLYIKTGWDRYSDLETRKYFNLANILEKRIYAGIDIPLHNTKAGILIDSRTIFGIGFIDTDLNPPFKPVENDWWLINNLCFESAGLYFGTVFRLNIDNLFHK